MVKIPTVRVLLGRVPMSVGTAFEVGSGIWQLCGDIYGKMASI